MEGESWSDGAMEQWRVRAGAMERWRVRAGVRSDGAMEGESWSEERWSNRG